MSLLTPPNFSSDGRAGAPAGEPHADSGAGINALVRRFAEDFGADAGTLMQVATLFREMRERAADIFVPASGALAAAFDVAAATDNAEGAKAIYAALGEWALDAEGEPIERMRHDCLRFQNAMTRGTVRLHGGNQERCADNLLALQRYNFLQIAVLASLSARGQESGGVTRTLPTPEYAAFMEIFRTTIEGHKRDGKQLGLLVIQIPRVEQVDGLLGLQRGEAFMLRVTQRMREGVLRKQDQLGRVSRDQLACLLPRIAGEGIAILAANKILGVLEAPIQVGDRSFPSDAVIGIAVYPDHGSDPQTLVRNGKLAVRAARDTPERTAVYNPEQGESEELKVRYEAKLRQALEQGTLDVAFEPQLNLKSGRIGGLGCSLRWRDAELGAVPEEQAIETAEASGLIREVTWWLFNNALRYSAEFARAGLQVPVCIKATAGALLQPDFAEFVGRALRTWDVPPSRLVVEIHESALAGIGDQIRPVLGGLKQHGLRIGMGGFGTGSSPLINIAQLPLDEMRLGAKFVGEMRQSESGAKVVRSLANLARDLGLRVAAEGVEDAPTALALSAIGCEHIQGGYVSAPMSAREILELEKSSKGLSQLMLKPPA